ncbi:hypothetical protein CYK24_03110 [Trueperella bernardiae]|uniref:Gp19/Gp15/Gp42 family protein n=1 Tax=Trueperella bernardiae TaxID=59561 RepID=A0AAW6ZFU5_9ACTO|nr:Gp19/Gp15/Gp42 family protein [Trueperella bernardiae]MDK8602110.1 Gp19/Gp15/Gp42 family protein [Trueperella bernardiae]PKZ89297.1 hypothetical protein CYK24_03110 [Trueperella bernardiae]
METFATAEDVAADLLRPLTTVETQHVDHWLERALAAIKRELGELPDRVEHPDLWGAVREVQARIVGRRYRAADGFVSESDGQYQYRADMAMRSGRVALTDEDREDLGISVGGLYVWNPDYSGGLR